MSVQVSGDLRLVTGIADQVTEVWFRAARTRPYGDGLLVETSGTVPVANGRVTATLAPGAAVMVLVAGGRPLESVPLIVPGSGPARLSDCVQAARVASGSEASELEQVLEDLAGVLAQVTGQADRAKSEADRAAAALGTKADTVHTHTIEQVTGLQTALGNKANASHTHTIPNITGLQSALDGKADSSHTHTIANVTGLQTALDGKAPLSHVHTLSQITNAPNSHSSTATASSLVSRDTGGRFQANAPIAANDVTNKAYVDGRFTALDKNTITVETEQQAQALTGLRVGDVVHVTATGNIYKWS